MSEEAARLLQEGIAAAKAGDKARAREMLVRATELDEMSEQAWLWLSGVVEDPEEMKICLENVLTINPLNERARKGLDWVETQLAKRAPPPPPEPPPLPTADTYTSPFEDDFFSSQAPSIEEQLAEPSSFAAPEFEEEGEPEPPDNRVACPACGAMNYDFATECVKCAFPFAITCPSCNELVTTETGLCSNCGAVLPLPTKLAGVYEREQTIEDGYREGLAFLQEGRPQEAKAAFEQVLQIVPDHIEALYSLGEACAKLGLTEQARDYWEEVKLRQPDHPYVDRSLESLVPARERRRMARERRKTERAKQQEKKRRRQESVRPEGQTLLDQYEREMTPKQPVPEEEMGLVEAFIYVFMVGLVLGVAYALNSGTELLPEQALNIAVKSGVVALVVVAFWIVLGIVTRLFGLIFKATGSMGSYAASAARFLFPFFLLVLPILLSIPNIVVFLPEALRTPLEQSPLAPWIVIGGLSFLWGLFLFLRGISRVGQIAFWKALIVVVLGLGLSLGLVYAANLTAGDQLETFIENVSTAIATPSPSASPTSGATPAPAASPTSGPTPSAP